MTGPAPLLKKFAYLIRETNQEGPVLDLACGNWHNGLYLAEQGLWVVLADKSREALDEAEKTARDKGLQVQLWEIDLEQGDNPLAENFYQALLVFRYLHRPLIPFIKKAIVKGGILIYETYTNEKMGDGPPRNPAHLLKPGELAGWFSDWEIFHAYEGILEDPDRTMAQLVCKKPF
jgi:SAM-dependent methyltransferase